MLMDLYSSFSSLLRFDALSNLMAICIFFFSLLIVIYSIKAFKTLLLLGKFYLYVILTLLASLGVVYANNMILLLVSWGFLGLLLYLMINMGEGQRVSATARKALIIVGGTDALMMFGLIYLWGLSDSLRLSDVYIYFNNWFAYIAYFCLIIAALAKAGAMPFHSWVPNTAEDAPVPVVAYLPAALDKFLGIYLLTRVTMDVFVMNTTIQLVLMIVGSVTIVCAVMLALVQHDLKRLLGFHAVSQVGYMVLGIGTANPLGVAGGLFHMINNGVYKAALFMTAGAVEKQTGTTDLDKLGGLGRLMPITFVTFLIASLAISGVPPFNGFASKWLIYQGILETGKQGGKLWIVWLSAAMFGSALTLASFLKLLHAVFMGQKSGEISKNKKIKEAHFSMWLPAAILAGICIVFGVFANQLAIKQFIAPVLPVEIKMAGVWSSGSATILMITALLIGLLFYLMGKIRIRESEPFIGGELLKDNPQMRVSGTAFYSNIKELVGIRSIYKYAEKGWFDIYEAGSNITRRVFGWFSYLHNGVLPTYLTWCLLGMMFLFYMLVIKV